MSAYAPVPAFADRRHHPRALVLIVAGHVALISAVMMAKSYVPVHFPPPPIIVDLLKEPAPPPENPSSPKPAHESSIDRPTQIVPIQQPTSSANPLPLPLPLPDPGPTIEPMPVKVAPPVQPARVGPRFVTPESDVKPPYPQSKLRAQEEAVLELRLVIDERGRVTAVDAVGKADPVFLAAARRHILAHWRYRPATEDGHPVATSTVITLHFRLD